MLDYDVNEWETQAKCLSLGVDTDVFYPPRDKALYKSIADQAKNICKGKDGLPACPVKRDCLMKAIETDELFGIWGGMSHRERNALVRKANRLKVPVEDLVDRLDNTWED